MDYAGSSGVLGKQSGNLKQYVVKIVTFLLIYLA